MKLSEIPIRDPFILPFDGKYYLYGTNGFLGFRVYVSTDLQEWSEPKTVFEFFDGFWGTQAYWAPEVHYYQGKFYLLATFKGDHTHRGTQILVADSPEGPFKVHSAGAVTPKEWECLDGTLYVEEGVPYMVFCHEWTQITDGEMCVIRLSEDLMSAVGKPRVLFKGSEPAWTREGADYYVTDGPFLHRTRSGKLLMLWSGFSPDAYVQAVALSDNDSISGNWHHSKTLLNSKNGGHGMLFEDFDRRLKLILHAPNWPAGEERAHVYDLQEIDDAPYFLATPTTCE